VGAAAILIMGSMRVVILPGRDVREVDARTAGDLLKALGLHRDAHLVMRGEDILTSDTRLREADQVEIWPVISGGTWVGGC
jgi:sulfur carrier protein ThiS